MLAAGLEAAAWSPRGEVPGEQPWSARGHVTATTFWGTGRAALSDRGIAAAVPEAEIPTPGLAVATPRSKAPVQIRPRVRRAVEHGGSASARLPTDSAAKRRGNPDRRKLLRPLRLGRDGSPRTLGSRLAVGRDLSFGGESIAYGLPMGCTP